MGDFDNETIDEKNIEYAIRKAIKQYGKTNHLADAMFWNHAIIILKEKYGFKENFNRALEKQTKEREKQ